MVDIQNQEEWFELASGRFIADTEISKKMVTLKRIRPECNQEDATNFSWDESGMAELFNEVYQCDTRYCPERKSWYTYDGTCWKKDTEGLLVSSKVREFVRLLCLYGSEITDEEKRKPFLTWVGKMGDRRFRERLIKDARDNMSINAAAFDNQPYLINCLNGTYDLDEMVFREHRWDDFLTMQTNFNFTTRDVSEIHFPRWDKFIDEVTCGDKEKARYLQIALGYSILGTSKEECMFILHGKTTRNGKSTLLSAIHHLLGNYAMVSPVSIICKSDRAKNAEAASPTIAALKGKRFVTMAESNQYGKLDEETIKQLTGGEEISARNLYESVMTFLPQFTMWLSCNDLPAVQDKSLFASDRIRVIEFNRHFTADERDETLKDLFQTQEAMQGIFAWLVAGCFMYKRFKLKMPEHLQEVVRQYEKDNDIVLQFLEDKCEQDDEAKVKQNDLYGHFKIWCKGNGYYIMNSKKFAAALNAHPEWVKETYMSSGYKCIKGLAMKG